MPGKDLAMTELIAGDWRAIPYPDAGSLIARFQQAWIAVLPRGVHPEKANILPRAVRAMPLVCYRRTLLCEVETVRTPDDLSIAAFLYGPFGIRLIDGQSTVIHELNEFHGVQLDHPEEAVAYGRFFCSAVHGGEGRFEIVETPDQLGGAKLSASVRDGIAPMAAEQQDGIWLLSATVRYGQTLFQTRFRLDRDGLMEMVDDDVLEVMEELRPERFESPFRILPYPPTAEGRQP
jgi:hypothetical protein